MLDSSKPEEVVKARKATLNDVPRLVHDAEAFFKASSLPGGFDPGYFKEFLEDWVPQENFWGLVTDTGSVALIFHPFFANGKKYAQEFWVYDAAGNGRYLIKAMEQEARRRGAIAIGVSTQLEQRGETLSNWFQRCGYVLRELALMKEL